MMTPDTVSLVAQIIRHQRAMANSVEKWKLKQVPSGTTRELTALIKAFRSVLDSYECQLATVDVNYDDSDDGDSSVQDRKVG